MSDDDTREPTPLLHLEDASRKINEAFQEFKNGEISQEELNNRINEAAPKLQDVGCNPEDFTINNKPVPENPQSVVYFYLDEEGVLRMTVRFPDYDDSHQLEGDAQADAAEMAGLSVLRLINEEHQRILQEAVARAAFHMFEQAMGGGEEGEDPDDPLSSITDGEVRKTLDKFLKH